MIEQRSRRTKVVKSYDGPALVRAEAERLAENEVDVVRVVYKRDLVPNLLEFIQTVAKARRRDRPLPVMLDIAGHAQGVIAGLKDPAEITSGEKITMSPVGGQGRFQVKAPEWSRLWTKDCTVFMGLGTVELKATSVKDSIVELEVVRGGTIYPDIDVVIPETRRDPERATVTVQELKPLVEAGIDYLIIPGEWSAERMRDFCQSLESAYGAKTPWLILKCDSEDVYERLNDLLEAVHGVLISRREMAFTMNPATVPMITKEIVQLCNDRAKITVTASEMLASMRRNATPTRAEVSDVANCVLDGTDAVVISEEVANGKYSDIAVEVMHKIICDIEESQGVRPNWIKQVPPIKDEMDAVAYNAFRTAERIKAKALVCITVGGNTALKLSSFQPPIPVVAVTFSEPVMRKVSIVRGVEPLFLDVAPSIDEVLPVVNDQLVRSSWLKPGDPIIFVSITLSPVGQELSNLFSVQNLT